MATFFALLSSAMWGTSDFWGGTLSRRLSALTVAAASEAIGLAGLLVAVGITGTSAHSTGYLGWGLLAAVSGSAGIIAFYRALATGTMGVVAPIAALGVVVPVLVGVGQGDRPSMLQDLGIVVAIVGVVLASGPELQPRDGGARGGARPLLLAAGAAFGFGIVFVALEHGATSSTSLTLVVMRAASVVVMLAIALATRPSQLRFEARDLPLLTVVGGFDLGANATFAYATRHGLLSVVSVLSSLYPAVTVVLARTVHHERLRPLQLGGVIAALGGVVLIAS
jgi:drug/metabolite transporter (DMT)-like permease